MMLEIALEADDEWDSSRSWEPLVRTAVEAAVAESAFPGLATSDRPVEVSVLLTGDDEVRRAQRGMARARTGRRTCSRFRCWIPTICAHANVAGPELLLGDIVLARGVCSAEAADKGVTVEQHATHLLVHGTLHLLGYDHHDEPDAADMEAREIRALERLGIANPYEVAA